MSDSSFASVRAYKNGSCAQHATAARQCQSPCYAAWNVLCSVSLYCAACGRCPSPTHTRLVTPDESRHAGSLNYTALHSPLPGSLHSLSAVQRYTARAGTPHEQAPVKTFSAEFKVLAKGSYNRIMAKHAFGKVQNAFRKVRKAFQFIRTFEVMAKSV